MYNHIFGMLYWEKDKVRFGTSIFGNDGSKLNSNGNFNDFEPDWVKKRMAINELVTDEIQINTFFDSRGS